MSFHILLPMKYVNNNSLSIGSFESALYSIALAQYSWANHEYVPRGASLFFSLCIIVQWHGITLPKGKQALTSSWAFIYFFHKRKELCQSRRLCHSMPELCRSDLNEMNREERTLLYRVKQVY